MMDDMTFFFCLQMDDMTLTRLKLTTSDNIAFIGIIYIKYKLFQIMEKVWE